MGRASIKSNDPIPLPHDGPLHQRLVDFKAKNSEKASQKHADLVIQAALECLQQKETIASSANESSNIFQICTLLNTLLNAKSIKEQLHTLQTFRSKTLQQRKQAKSETTLTEKETLYRATLYRIFLEWFLSIQTPVPLRRAIGANLDGILLAAQEEQTTLPKVTVQVLDSIIEPSDQTTVWKQPLHTLHEALNYKVTHDLLLNSEDHVQRILQFLQGYATQHLLPVLHDTLESSTSDTDAEGSNTVFFVEEKVTVALQQSIQLGGILKTVLAEAPSMAIPDNDSPHPQDDLLAFMETFLWNIMSCRIVPVDALNNLGMAYGRVLFLRHPPKQGSIATHISNLTQHSLTDLTTIAMVQGLAATAPIAIMLQESHCLLQYFQQQSNEADPGVRLAALKGIHTLISRCLTRITTVATTPQESELQSMQSTTQTTLEILLHAWEDPPNRRVSNSIPSVFQKLIALMQELEKHSPSQNNDNKKQDATFQELVLRLLAQPSNRKGRYRALETLLPLVGARHMISLGGWKLIESLLEGIGDRNSHSAGPIADLWEKMLSDLLQDMLMEDSKSSVSKPPPDSNKKNMKKGNQFAPKLVQQVLPNWWETWVPSLATALVSTTASRRKHVEEFCLPRIVSMVGGRKQRQAASSTYACLLNAINSRAGTYDSDNRLDGIHNRELWATLEVIRHAHLEKLVDLSSESKELVDAIKGLVSHEKLSAALKHFSSNIRLVAFQTIQPIVATCSSQEKEGGLAVIEQEIALWKEAFPYAIKTEGKEYKSSLLQCLTVFLDRVSNLESASLGSQTAETAASVAAEGLPMLHSFVVDFLILDVVMRQAAYPASISEKEAFAIELLECIVAFASRDSIFVSKKMAVYERKRRPSEAGAAKKILETLLSREGLAALFSLLHSIWDGTRSFSYRLLSRLVLVAQANDLRLAHEYTATTQRTGMMARAVFLSSSPRQREADTGARILAFLNFSLVEDAERWSHVRSLVELLEDRLTTMKNLLSALLSGAIDPVSSDGGTRLPLAHGLIHSLRLVVEHMGYASNNSKDDDDDVGNQEVCERMAQIFCLAIQVSLAVVADVKDGAVIDGMDENLMTATGTEGAKEATPLNVNTGAIGANGTFSSINPTEKDEYERRIATQRIVMGSWLLTREACGALATLLTSTIFFKSHSLLDKAGSLLISTLVSLKHAGGAFSSHRALQQISEFCFKSNDPLVGSLPASWANRLLEEISAGERVRDSTLRRSTGYALGFLAIMRSELSSRVEPRSLCPYILKQILRLSLPKVEDIQNYFDKLNLSAGYRKSVILQLAGDDESFQYETRSRVHALNILRLVILDAPLANEVKPIVGEAIVSALIGYSDDSWTVRNSSTMVFAAVMLRSIDADKNAVVTDTTANNATTIGELFKSYPLLPDFLTAVVNGGDDALELSNGMAKSPIFPILLLLARVQRVSNSGSKSKEMSEQFIPAVVRCLQNRHLLVRTAASRALANLCSGPIGQSVSSLTSMVNACHSLLVVAITGSDWNSVHGALLAIKELASRFQESGSCLDASGLLQYLTKLTGVLLPRWPPPCVSAVYEILETVLQTSNIDTNLHQQLEEASDSTTLYLAKTPVRPAGSSALATAGQVVCKHLAANVWDLRTSKQEVEGSLSKLGMILNSEMIDVRLYGCKAFKKVIYDNVDRVVASDSVARKERVERVVAISRTLLHALLNELDRSGGPHPPALRRLSRCVLECIGAFNKLIQENRDFGLLDDELINELTSLAERLVEQDSWLHDNLTVLSGNGVEILAFAIGWHLQQSTSFSSDGQLERIRRFMYSISQLNNPVLSWRLRHSAAVSIEHSRLLELDGMNNETIKQAQHRILEDVLSMLQDPDPDVRCAAGRAVQGIRSQDQPSQFTFPPVSQYALEEAYQYAYKPIETDLGHEEVHKYAVSLLRAIVKRCEGMESKLSVLQRDLQQTESSSDLDTLLNVGTERKIFEDETVNAYEEPAFANQLAVHVLLHLELGEERRASMLAAASSLADLCDFVLSNIKPGAGDIFHEVSRSNAVFVEFHSVLVASSACVNIGLFDDERARRIRELAAETLSIAGAREKLHPSIGASLQVLAEADSEKQEARASVLQCLFLLPPRMIS